MANGAASPSKHHQPRRDNLPLARPSQRFARARNRSELFDLENI